MLDNQLISLIISTLTNGLSSLVQPSISVKQKYQPTQQGVNSNPTVYLFKVGDFLRGTPYVSNVWDATVLATVTGYISGNTFTVTDITSGTVQVGQTLSGTNIPANVYITNMGTGNGGIGTYVINQYITVGAEAINLIPGEVTTSIQQYETTFQLSALATQDPSNVNSLTASDILNYAVHVMQNQSTIANFESQGVGILKVTNVRNTPFVDDRQRFEYSPSFDFTLTHKQTILNVSPIILETIGQIIDV